MNEIRFVQKRTGDADRGAGAAVCCGEPPAAAKGSCCPPPAKRPPFVTGAIDTRVGPVPVVSTAWDRHDRWGMLRSRTSAFRMRYAVAPGLYAVGAPAAGSDVFVTANYKLSFDLLRRSLAGMHAWVLVLDTKSINVWCAAGKGTFGTDELVARIEGTRIAEIVEHRRIILPQLGAAGVNARAVRDRTGFRVSYGPVRAGDIADYVRNRYRKTREMSTVLFTLADRLVLTPMEVNPAMKKFPWFAAAVLLLFGLGPEGVLFERAWHGGMPFLVLGLVSVLAGAVGAPALLPFLPFRSFALKGWVLGLAAVLAAARAVPSIGALDATASAAAYLFFPAMTSYLALQFTGATTFTGQSGVEREMRYAVPAYLAAIAISVVLLFVSRFTAGEVL